MSHDRYSVYFGDLVDCVMNDLSAVRQPQQQYTLQAKLVDSGCLRFRKTPLSQFSVVTASPPPAMRGLTLRFLRFSMTLDSALLGDRVRRVSLESTSKSSLARGRVSTEPGCPCPASPVLTKKEKRTPKTGQGRVRGKEFMQRRHEGGLMGWDVLCWIKPSRRNKNQ